MTQIATETAIPAEVAAIIEADLDRVVHLTYTRRQLRDAFNLVCDKTNWKNPISGEIAETDRAIVAAAIDFYAGGLAKFVPAGKGRLSVTAPGYYILIGA